MIPAPSALAMLLAAATPVLTPPPSPLGKWANPKRTLAVRTEPCGQGGMCGAIVWAADQAMADARDAGVPRLIGTELLQNYRPAGSRQWAGRVYIPDMGRSFSSRIQQTSADTLIISGCLIGRLFCKSQVWHRVS